MINFNWITSKLKGAGYFVLFILIFIASQTFSQSVEKNHSGFGSLSSELENGIDAPSNVNLIYQLELFPGQIFKGNYYYWSDGGTKTANLQFLNTVPWLSISPSNFTSNSCSDIVRVEFNFVAPQTPGIYDAVIQDLNGNWNNTNITLSVTENPTSAIVQSYQLNQGQTISKLDTLYWNGFGNFSCLNNYVPGSTRLYSFAEKDSVSWFSIAPSNLTLPLSGVGTIESTILGTTAGSDHVYVIEEAEYASLCFFFRVNVNVIKPRYPVFIVPGIAGTYASNLDYDLGWLLKRGISPDSIQIDPLGRVYDDIIITLENLGYEKGKDLFLVNYDWRLTPGPVDNNIDGHVDGLTGASITSGQFNYGVDYLGWFIKQACERWRQDHNEELDSIDIISHSTGGLVTRTYIQSDAYGAVYDNSNNYKLPKIRNFVMIGVPNRGASKPWNPIQDNWTGDVAYRFVLSKIINRAYQKVLQDKIITGPDGNITKNSIMDSSGVPNKELFISKYVPTIRYLLATYNFIDFGSGLTNINNDVDKRNTILLDLNNGFDINPLNDPNGFLDSANVIVIYGTGETTKFSVIQRTDFELAALQSFTDYTPSSALPGTIWYKDIDFDNNGDGTVPTISSASQFLIDTRATLIEFTTGDHTKLVSQINVQSTILDLLGVPYNLADISTGHSTNYNVVSNIISDPVELVLSDGSGNRIGYTNTTGAITEIQNSFWTGNTDGMGYVFGSVQEPINLKLTGLGEDYYVMVSVEDSGKYGGVVLEGFLASGEVINYQITLDPVSVEEISSVIPQNFALAQNYPNPFNPSTKISWQSPVGSHQTLKDL